MGTLRRSQRNTYFCGCEAYIYDKDSFLQARDILRKSTENDLEAFRKALEQHDGLCMSMLMYALQNQPHSSVIKIIMDRVLAEGKQSHKWMVCALRLACQWDYDIETIKLIMNTTTYGPNFVYCNHDWKPLHEAAAKGNLDHINLLLVNGANIHVKTAKGHTALHVAAIRGRLECVKILVAAGADPAAQNNEGKTPLECAPKTNNAIKTFLHPLSPIPKRKRTKGNIANNQKTKSNNKSNPNSTLSNNLNENNNNYTKTNNTSLHKRKVVDIIDLIETEKEIKTEESSSNTSSAACSKRQPDQQVNYNHNLNSSTESKRPKLPTTSTTTTTTTTTSSLQNIQNVPVSTGANASLPSAPAVAPATTASSVPTPTLVQPPIPLLPTVPPGIPNNSQIKKIRVKRRGADGESWYVRVPAGCTRERLLELIQAKTGFACTVVLDERNVRIADTDDVNDLANDCELTIY